MLPPQLALRVARRSALGDRRGKGWRDHRERGPPRRLARGVRPLLVAFGFGLGTLPETQNAQFNIAYALGRSPENPVQLRQSRVHIGILAFF